MNTSDKKTLAVARLLGIAKTEDELVKLLDDLFTSSEIDKAHERIKIVACLASGLSQRETVKKSGAAIATVSRGANVMKKSSLIIPTLIAKARQMSWWRALIWRA